MGLPTSVKTSKGHVGNIAWYIGSLLISAEACHSTIGIYETVLSNSAYGATDVSCALATTILNNTSFQQDGVTCRTYLQEKFSGMVISRNGVVNLASKGVRYYPFGILLVLQCEIVARHRVSRISSEKWFFSHKNGKIENSNVY